MSKLFIDAYRYRQGLSRNPREDYLTEILRHLLMELDNGGWSSRAFRELLDIQGCPANIRMKWVSQYRISCDGIADGKRPDLVGQGNGESLGRSIFIIIENKISAAFTMHRGPVTTESETEWKDQLTIYSSHLERLTEIEFRYLVLISHRTEPPKDFNGIYLSWSKFHSRLKKLIGSRSLEGLPRAEFIAESLLSLLEEWGMESIELNLVDIASLNAYVNLYRASARFGEVARKIVPPLLTERYWLGTRKRIGIAGAGLEGITPPDFFGVVLSLCDQNGKPLRVCDNPIVIWAGALLGNCYDAIQPCHAGLAELSVGIGVWHSQENNDEKMGRQVSSIAQRLSDACGESAWNVNKQHGNANTDKVLLISASLSYLDALRHLQHEGRNGMADWESLAEDFFRKNFGAITALPDDDIDAIANGFE